MTEEEEERTQRTPFAITDRSPTGDPVINAEAAESCLNRFHPFEIIALRSRNDYGICAYSVVMQLPTDEMPAFTTVYEVMSLRSRSGDFGLLR